MSTVQVNLKKKSNGDYVAPNTTTAAVYDAAKEQALSATLVDLPDKSTLGYPSFSTAADYDTGDVVYYGNKLWKFTSDHEAGAWNSEEVDEYSIKDILDALAKSVGGDKFRVIAEAITYLDARLSSVEDALRDPQQCIDLNVMKLDAAQMFRYGVPAVLESSVAGAPSAANVPSNWDADTMGIWAGCPLFVGQVYSDKANGKIYMACKVSNSTGDWKLLN